MAVRSFNSGGVVTGILFLIVGGVLGGIAGEFLTGASLGGMESVLLRKFEIFDIQHVSLNLYFMKIQFGIYAAPHLLSLIGMVLAFLLFRRIR